jgi:hypothetical protein
MLIDLPLSLASYSDIRFLNSLISSRIVVASESLMWVMFDNLVIEPGATVWLFERGLDE